MKIKIATLFLAVGCWASLAFAQGGAQAGGGAGQAGGAGGGFGGAVSAPVPQYWISDADIFIGSARAAATQLAKEGRFNVQSPQIISNQAAFLNNSLARAIQDLEALSRNAQSTNPNAIPAIRETIAQLVAAKNQATQVAQSASSGQLGPTYQTTVQSVLAHLNNASRRTSTIAQVYGGGGAATSAGARGTAGGGAGNAGAGR